MSSNPSTRKIHSRLAEIRQLEKEVTYILMEHPMCVEGEEKESLIAMAISHIEAKLRRTKCKQPNYTHSSAIYLCLAIQEFEDASTDNAKKSAGKKVTKRLLDLTDAELLIIADGMKETALSIASMYLAEL